MGTPMTRSRFARFLGRRRTVLLALLRWGVPGIVCLVCLLVPGWPGYRGVPAPSPVALSFRVQEPSAPLPVSSISPGAGAGGRVLLPAQQTAALAICLPGDMDCLLHAVDQSLSQQFLTTARPLIKGIVENGDDLLFQTPAALTYQNPAVLAIWKALMGVATAALVCLIVIGGYNAVVAPYLGLPHSSISAFLPRLLLAFGAASFSLDFLGLFIELENTLCQTVMQSASMSTLTNVLLEISNPANLGNIFLFLLIVLMLVLLVCLLGQMIVRIGMVALLIALAGPALLCLALPQTQRYGQLWLTLFSSSVLVQFFQVIVLALGGMLLTTTSSTALWHLPDGIGPALLCTGMLFLTLKIPGMLNHWALMPMQAMTGGGSVGESVGAAQSYIQDQATRQASIDALASMI